MSNTKVDENIEVDENIFSIEHVISTEEDIEIGKELDKEKNRKEKVENLYLLSKAISHLALPEDTTLITEEKKDSTSDISNQKCESSKQKTERWLLSILKNSTSDYSKDITLSQEELALKLIIEETKLQGEESFICSGITQVFLKIHEDSIRNLIIILPLIYPKTPIIAAYYTLFKNYSNKYNIPCIFLKTQQWEKVILQELTDHSCICLYNLNPAKLNYLTNSELYTKFSCCSCLYTCTI